MSAPRPWVGKLRHSRNLCDDWGCIRDESGQMVLQVSCSEVLEKDIYQHRKNGTDPAQPVVDYLLSVLNAETKESRLSIEIQDRMRHFYGQTDGTMRFPNSAEGDLLKLVHRLLSTEEASKSEPSGDGSGSSEFRVKLLQLWTFNNSFGDKWSGVWQTQGVSDIGADNERWTLQRVIVTGEGQTLNHVHHDVPTWLLLKFCSCLKLQEIYNSEAGSKIKADGVSEGASK